MQRFAYPVPEATERRNYALWFAIALLGLVFFYKDHNFSVTLYEMWTPWSDDGDPIAAGGNLLKGLALGTIAALGACLWIQSSWRPFEFNYQLGWWIVAYVAWCVLSLLWSVDAGMTIRNLAVLLFCFAGALGIARRFQPRDLLFMVFVLFGCYFAVGFFTELALGTFKPWSSEYRFAGTVHPNTQGGFLSLLCVSAFCLSRTSPHKRWFLLVCVIAALFVLLTKSRTATAATMLGMVTVWCIDFPARVKILTVLAVTWVVGTTILFSMLAGMDVIEETTQAAMLGREAESEALTGRIPIWMELSRYLQDRPMFGYGYQAFWNPKHIELVSDELEWTFREAHSSYIEAVLAIGIIGAFLMLACVAQALRLATRQHRVTHDPAVAFIAAQLMMIALTGFFESIAATVSLETLIAGTGMLMLAIAPRIEPTAELAPLDLRFSARFARGI